MKIFATLRPKALLTSTYLEVIFTTGFQIIVIRMRTLSRVRFLKVRRNAIVIEEINSCCFGMLLLGSIRADRPVL